MLTGYGTASWKPLTGWEAVVNKHGAMAVQYDSVLRGNGSPRCAARGKLSKGRKVLLDLFAACPFV